MTAEALPRPERAPWRVMYGYVRPYRLALLAGGLLSLLTGATGLALPLLVRVLIGDLVTQGYMRVHATLGDSMTIDERRELIRRTLRGLRAL